MSVRLSSVQHLFEKKFADPEVRGVRGVFVGVFWKAWCGVGEQNKVTLADPATSFQPQPFSPISIPQGVQSVINNSKTEGVIRPRSRKGGGPYRISSKTY